jgi:hypothetical protein
MQLLGQKSRILSWIWIRNDPTPGQKVSIRPGSGRTILNINNALWRRLHQQQRPLAALNVTERITAELLQLLNKQECVLTTGCRPPPLYATEGR